MEQEFFVAVATISELWQPTIVEKFNNRKDADSYAALMSRAKHRKYIVLELVTEVDGTDREN